MHEMGIALQVIEIATASIPPENKNAKVRQVNLNIGKLAAVVPESLRFCFDVAVRDTQLDGAELHIEEIPVVARCRHCHTQWTLEGPVFSCINCKSSAIDMISGRELDIVSIEIEEQDAEPAA